MTKLGVNIKKIRTTKGLSQQAFADLFELTRGNISSYEENRAEPRIETVVRIANYFGIPVEHFITQNLTINEILKFNGDKLLEEENHIIRLQLREVPFINDNIYMKCCYQELAFNDWAAFPKLVLPETNNHNLIALTFNQNIAHHASLPAYQMHDVLVFEEVTQQNIHLCHHKTGLYTAEREIMLGRYEMDGGPIELVLNDFKKLTFDFEQPRTFWKVFAVYQHIH
ncbi:helix-turn-helix domain-containing protein [Paraflavitalea pollutisoli]|uniref:helix-turn-helix domain-containing protein n=1 Tax=Paraflavitalea pollutisoli TaxID=3034143 RepID=UPI0023ED820C|nr:helix-turn-helix transcriptional regulator [Paraflavitalea sp. H1-2-19X]